MGYLHSTVLELLSAFSSGGIVSGVSGSLIIGSAGSIVGSTAVSVASEFGESIAHSAHCESQFAILSCR